MTDSSDSRRSFLKTTAAGASAAALPWYFSTSPTLADEIRKSGDKLNIGVITVGDQRPVLEYRLDCLIDRQRVLLSERRAHSVCFLRYFFNQ